MTRKTGARPTARHDAIAHDLDALKGVPGRFAATEGEVAFREAVAERLPEGLSHQVEPFVAGAFAPERRAIAVALMVVGALVGLGWPLTGALVVLLASLALASEATGPGAWARLLLVRRPAYNLVSSLPAEHPSGSIVVTAPLDVPRVVPVGPGWRGLAGRPLAWFVGLGLVIAGWMVVRWPIEALGFDGGPVHLALLGGLGVALVATALRLRLDPDGRDEPGGVVVALELLRRLGSRPVPGVDVHVVFTASSRAGQEGMHAFLEAHTGRLARPLLVVALDGAGAPPLQAVATEGPLIALRHRWTGPALIERLQWAGIQLPMVARPWASDGYAARVKGARAVTLGGGGGAVSPRSVADAADVVETVLRWYAVDVARVSDDRGALEALGQALGRDEAGGSARRRRQSRRPPSKPERHRK